MVGQAADVKACLGAAFIHYIAYCVFYSIDAIKLAASDDPKQQNNNPNAAQRGKNRENAKQNDSKDINKQNALGGKPNPPGMVMEHNIGGTNAGARPVGLGGKCSPENPAPIRPGGGGSFWQKKFLTRPRPPISHI